MSVSPLRRLCGRQGRYSCRQACVVTVSWENCCQAQISLVRWVRHLWNKQVCTWAQRWDGLQWLMAEVKTVPERTCGISWGVALLPLGEWASFVPPSIGRSVPSESRLPLWLPGASHSPSLLGADYPFKGHRIVTERANRRWFGVEEAREGNWPFDSGPFNRKQNKQTCFTGAIVSLVSCLRKCFPLKGLKRLGVCVLNGGNTFLDWLYFSTPAVVN